MREYTGIIGITIKSKIYSYRKQINVAEQVNWKSIYNLDTVDSKVEAFTMLTTALFDQFAPVRLIRVSKTPMPWLTSTVKKLMSLRNRALSKY